MGSDGVGANEKSEARGGLYPRLRTAEVALVNDTLTWVTAGFQVFAILKRAQEALNVAALG